MIVIDFETRSTVDIRRSGAYRYAADPTTDILCLAWTKGGDVFLWWPDHFDEVMGRPKANLKYLFAPIARGEIVEAHNAAFERYVWKHVGEARYGWPAVPLHQWRCTAARAAAVSLPRKLDTVCKVLGLQEQKDAVGHRTMLTVSKPRRLKDKPGIHWHEDVERLSKVFEYCRQDVRAEYGLSQVLPHLTEDELAVWQLDQIVNERGVGIDLQMALGAIGIDALLKDELNDELSEITGGVVTAGTQRDNLLRWMQSEGAPLKDLTKDTMEYVAHSKQPWATDYIRRAAEIRMAVAKGSIAKYQAALDMVASDGRARDLLMYCGAGTGRWSGKGIQPQNMVRNTPKDMETPCSAIAHGDLGWLRVLYSDPVKVLSTCSRGMIVSAPGYELMVADFAQIEARGTLWLAHDPGIEVFRRGEDIYCHMAGRIYGEDGREIRAAYKAGDEEAFAKRFRGKEAVLGLGYQMGWSKFIDRCALQGVEVIPEESKKIVSTFREEFSMVPALWALLQRQAIDAVRHPGKEMWINGKVSFLYDERFLWLRLPSGRRLAYFKPRVIMKTMRPRCWDCGVDMAVGTCLNCGGQVRQPEPRPALVYEGVDSSPGRGRKWTTVDMYGGKWLENCVQALCRDLMAGAMLRAEAAGYHVILTVHDEVVAEVPRGFGSVEEFESIMCELPAWAEGFPLKAEGWRDTRYHK